jgi:hypothetical protein
MGPKIRFMILAFVLLSLCKGLEAKTWEVEPGSIGEIWSSWRNRLKSSFYT